MRVLGIDPGLRLTGYACVDMGISGQDAHLIEAGVLRLKSHQPLVDRLRQLHDDLQNVIADVHPAVLAVEALYSMYRNPRTAILMAHARGVVLLQAAIYKLELEEFTPTEVKRAVAGKGHASKEQVQRAVMVQCGLSAPPSPPDVADAIAIALCAARRRQVSIRTP